METSAKPFLKWAGGKGQLIDNLTQLFPKELHQSKIEYYYEPFLGSGALFFHIVNHFPIKSAYLFDINPELILTYRVVQRDVDPLINELALHETKYLKLPFEERNKYFYKVRENYNQTLGKINYGKYSRQWSKRAAQFIFLNKTCYNGLYRVNSKGHFNVPAGKYVNPRICNETNLNSASKALGIAEIINSEFTEVLKKCKPKSFIYFDPPYRPISKTSHFRSYYKSEFGDESQKKLFQTFQTLHKKGAKAMISNSDPRNYDPKDDFFDDLYKRYHITRVRARRRINSISSKRGFINEIVITNYSV